MQQQFVSNSNCGDAGDLWGISGRSAFNFETNPTSALFSTFTPDIIPPTRLEDSGVDISDILFSGTETTFTVNVTEPAVHWTISNEDWSQTVNVRFFNKAGLSLMIPLADIEIIADGVHVNVIPYTVNLAGWQTETNILMISKYFPVIWQNLTLRVTVGGQVLEVDFTNNRYVPPVPDFTWTISDEDWRQTINVRFFDDTGLPLIIPFDDIEIIADGVHVGVIAYTVNLAGWQTETSILMISKYTSVPWQNLTLRVTRNGMSRVRSFINNYY
jgi:hypothetical protein